MIFSELTELISDYLMSIVLCKDCPSKVIKDPLTPCLPGNTSSMAVISCSQLSVMKYLGFHPFISP